MVKEVGKVFEYINIATEMEQQIKNGPRGDFENYGDYLAKLSDADEYLRTYGSSFASTPQILEKLDYLMQIGMFSFFIKLFYDFCEQLFLNFLIFHFFKFLIFFLYLFVEIFYLLSNLKNKGKITAMRLLLRLFKRSAHLSN